MVNGVTAPEELGEQPKDADPAREPHSQKGEHGSGPETLPPLVTHPGDTYPFPMQTRRLWR